MPTTGPPAGAGVRARSSGHSARAAGGGSGGAERPTPTPASPWRRCLPRCHPIVAPMPVPAHALLASE